MNPERFLWDKIERGTHDRQHGADNDEGPIGPSL